MYVGILDCTTQSEGFEVQHQAGFLYTNADELSRRLVKRKTEKKGGLLPTVCLEQSLTLVPRSQGLLLPVGQPCHSQWGTVSKMEGTNTQLVVWQRLVPHSMHAHAIKAVHGSVGAGHFGYTKTLQRLQRKLYWAGSHQDTEQYVHACDTCTALKDQLDTPMPIAAISGGSFPHDKGRQSICMCGHGLFYQVARSVCGPQSL